MTEVSFLIQFPKFDVPSRKVHLRTGIHVIYGESGVGKSGLGRRMVSLSHESDHPNFNLSRISGFISPMIVAQDPDAQIVAPTVARELAFNLENAGWPAEKIQHRIKIVAERFNFSFGLERHPSMLSGGERELLNLASALTSSPDFLIIDDGLSFLSEQSKKMCVTILKEWCERFNAVVLWLTSDPSDLQYSENGWQLCLDHLEHLEKRLEKIYPKISIPPGKLSLKFNKLSFAYPNSGQLFNDQCLQLKKIRSLAVIGENGSGKSTLGALLSQMETPHAGDIKIEIYDRSPSLAYLPQSPERLFGGYTPEEMAKMILLEGLASDDFAHQITDSLASFQIPWIRISQTPLHLLSLSESRIVLIVMLSQAKYELLILDEPMFSLGVQQKKKMIEFLGAVLSNKHLIFVTHDEMEAAALSETTLVIANGIIHSRPAIKTHA